MYNDVRDFHIAFGLEVSDEFKLPEDKSVRELRRRLLKEEVFEYIEADSVKNDIVEVAKELSDVLYIIFGTCVVYGLGDVTNLDSGEVNISEIFNELGKTPEFPSNERGVLRNYIIDSMVASFKLYEEAEDIDNLEGIKCAFRLILSNVIMCCITYKIRIFDVFSEVHKSNMNKLVDGKPLRREDGKVLKPVGWIPPDIKKILFP